MDRWLTTFTCFLLMTFFGTLGHYQQMSVEMSILSDTFVNCLWKKAAEQSDKILELEKELKVTKQSSSQ